MKKRVTGNYSSYHRNHSPFSRCYAIATFLCILFISFSYSASAQFTRYAVADGNWNATSTWSATSGGASGASIPVAGDIVYVGNTATGIDVTIPAGYTANCATLYIGAATNASNNLILAGASSTLNVSGHLTITRPSNANANNFKVNAGTATIAGTVTLAGSATNANRVAEIDITTGTLTINTDLVFVTGNNNSNILDMSGGAGTLYLGGAFTGTTGTFTAGTGSTVIYNKAGTQTVASAFGDYENLTLAGSGAKTITGITVNNILSMQGTATTAGTVPTFGAAATLEYTGSALQTTGTEFKTPWTGTGGVIIDNASGVKLGATKTVNKGISLLSGQLDLNAYSLTVGNLQGTGTITSIAAGAVTLTVGSDNLSTTFSGLIQNGSGNLALTKNGTGTLTLSGNNSYSGLTTISAGMIKLGAAGTSTNTPLGTVSAGTSITSGAALDLNGFTLGTAEALTIRGTGISSGGALTNTSATDVTYSGLLTLGASSTILSNAGDIHITNPGIITGTTFTLTLDGTASSSLSSILATVTGAVIKNGTGTWTLSGTNIYTGATNINAGVLKIGASTTVLGTIVGITTVASGASLDLNGFSITTAEPLTLNGTGVAGSGALTNTSATTSNFLGLLKLGSASSIVASNGDINLTAIGSITGSGFGLTLDGPGDGNLAAIIATTTGTIVKNGAGTWTLSGINTYTGATTINAGTLKISGLGAGIANNSAVTVGGKLDLNGNSETVGSITGAGTITSSAGGSITLTVGGNNTHTTFSGIIEDGSGTVALTKTGTGTLTLSGNNSYAGVTTISAGTIKIGAAGNASDGPLGGNPSGTTVTSGAALDLNGFTLAHQEPLTLNGTGISSAGALTNSSATDVTYSGLITLSSAASISTNAGDIDISNTGTMSGSGFGLTLGGSGNGSISSIIGTGAGTLTKAGSGVWTLSGANTFTGATAINAGTLKLGASTSVLGTTAGITTVASGAVLDLNGFTLSTAEPLTISGTGISAGGALTNSSATDVVYSGLLKLGAAASVITNAGDIVLTNTGTITGATFGLTLGGSSGGSLANIIGTTTGTFTKSGTGTWILSGANTFTGATTISAGVLKLGASTTVLGTIAGITTVNSGASLDLNGFTLSTAEPLTINGTGISAGGALTNTSASAVTYSGLLKLGSNSSVVSSNGTITFTATGTITGSGFDLTLSGAGNGLLAGIVGTGSGELIKSGNGMWTLSAANTFTGGATLNAGGLNVNNSQALGTSAGTFTINGGTIDNTTAGAITTLNYPMTWHANFAFTGTQSLNLGTGNTSLTADVELTASANSLTVGGVVSGSAYDLTKKGNGILNFVSNAVTVKDLTISAGTLKATSGTLNVRGDFSNSGTFTHNSGLLNFNGTTPQSLGGSTSSTFYNLTLNNSNGLTVNINSNISNTLTMTNGSLAIAAGSTLNISSGDAVAGTGFGTSKHIITRVNTSTGAKGFLRIGNFSGSALYPIGNGTYYLPALINATGTNDFSVSAFPGATTNGEPNGSAFSALTQEFIVDAIWYVNRNGGSSATTLFVNWPAALEGLGFQSLLDAEIGISRYTGSGWDDASGAGSQSINYSARNPLISFGAFGIGKVTIPLAMKFKSIKGYPVANGLQLDWTIVNENRIADYEVERSVNGRDFSLVGKLPASGNNAEANYSWIDRTTDGGTYFYRIKAIDEEGKITYSSIIRIDQNLSTVEIAIYPNPVTDGHLSLRSGDLKKGNYTINVFNNGGQRIYGQPLSHSGGAITQLIELPQSLAPGMYFLQMEKEGVKVLTKSFIIH